MPRKIIWTVRATREWVEILEYWTNRNKSNSYSLKLDEFIVKVLNYVIELPESGQATEFPSIRTIIVRDYTVYYRIRPKHIDILAIWDSRRDPKKFKL